MLRAVEEAFENHRHSANRSLVTPQLEPGVVASIEKSLAEWKTVCQLLRVDQNDRTVS